MADIGHFNADAVDPDAQSLDPVPPGPYKLVITNSDVRSVKDKPNERYLWLEHEIVEGPAKGRKIFNNLNLWNSNAQAVKIAEATLSALCRAVGKRQISNSAELHGMPFTAEISVDPAKGQYGPQNRIKKYLFEDKTVSAAQTTMATAAAGGATPWGQG